MRILCALIVVCVACGNHNDPVIAARGSAGVHVDLVLIDADTGSAAPVALGSDGLPVACAEWRASLDKLATCKDMPHNASDSLRSIYVETSKGWGQLPMDARQKLGPICQAGADSVLKGAKATCGW